MGVPNFRGCQIPYDTGYQDTSFDSISSLPLSLPWDYVTASIMRK